MKRIDILMAMAGLLIMISLYLNTLYPEGYWLWLTAFVGFNLFQSRFTKLCLPDVIMKKFNIGTD